MTVKEFLEMNQCDYDVADKEYDTVVTCCCMDSIKDNYDRFCDLLYSKVTIIRGGDYPVANWCGFVQKNMDKFREFTNEYWEYNYPGNDDELIYQWIKEFHGYLAGMVSEKFYGTLVEFFKGLEVA